MKTQNYGEMSRYLPPLLLALLCLDSSFSAPSVSREDRRQGLAYLAQTRAAVLDATRGLSEAQWRFKPAPDRWSIAEIAEHLALAEDFFFTMVTGQVMKSAAGMPGRDYHAVDRIIRSVVPDRSNKAQAPEPLVPAGRFAAPAAAIGHFLSSRARTAGFVKSAPGLRDHVMESPLGEPLDAYQWLMFAAAHSERHTRQILEVRAHPGFPKQ